MAYFKNRFQQQSSDCGATCLQMIAQHYGKKYEQLWLDELCNTDRTGSTLLSISEAAEIIGFRTLAVKCQWEFLQTQTPCILHWQASHFVVLYKIKRNKAYIADPLEGKKVIPRHEFTRYFAINDSNEGVVLLLEPSEKFFESDPPADIKKIPISLYFLYGNRKLFSRAILCLFALALIQFTFPFITQAIVDVGIRGEDVNFIYMMAGGYGVLYLSQIFSSLLRNAYLLRIGHNINLSLVSDYLRRLMDMQIGEFEKKQPRDFLQRYHESQRIRNFFANTLVDAIYGLTVLLVLSLVLWVYSSTILWIFGLGFIIYTAYVLIYIKRLKRLEALNFRQSSQIYSEIHQIISCKTEITINGSQKRRRWNWEVKQRAQFETEHSIQYIEQLQLAGAGFIGEVKNILIIGYCATSVIHGEMTLGSMLAIQYILGQLNLPMHQLVLTFREALEAWISLKRLQEIQVQPVMSSNHTLQHYETGGIEIRQLSFSFPNGVKPVLDKLSFYIPENKITAIVGPSGSGKTTLLKILLKCYSIHDGSVLVNGKDLLQTSYQQWYSQCGVVMQDGGIFDDTLRANITESDSQNSFDETRFGQAVSIARVDEFVNRLPYGYQTLVGTNGIPLSGGQRQRILLARALYKDPAYLFLDEATSALDTLNEQSIMHNLRTYSGKRTTIIIAHRLSTVKLADQILVLNEGQLEEVGNHLQLTQKKGFYYQLVNEQLTFHE